MAADKSGEVIDLHSRTSYQPDMAALARSHLINARTRMGMTTAEFAEVLKPLLPSSPPTAGLIENWETTSIPPGDVLVAVGVIARTTPISADSEGSEDLLNQVFGKRFADVAAVFTTRSELYSQLPPTELFDGAVTIDAAGLSLNMVCQQFPDDQLRQLVDQGTTMRCLFLAPRGQSIGEREREENLPAGHLSALTEINIQILSERVRNRLPSEAQERLQLATYEETIRFNIVIVDQKVAIAQPYFPVRRGVESPTFVVRRQATSPGLYPFFESTFEWLWERRTPV